MVHYSRRDQQNLSDVFSAFKEVNAAKTRAREAETRLRELRKTISEAQKKLSRREEVETHYDAIIQKNTTLREGSLQKMQSAIALVDTYSQEADAKKAELESLKKEHAKQLEPLQEKAERAKHAFERAEIEYKTAEKSLAQAKAADLASREGASDKTREQAKAHVEDALVSEKSAKTFLEAAKSEYETKRNELDQALAEAHTQEETVQKAYFAAQKQVNEQKQRLTKKSQAADAAQKELDEAEEIFSTPQETRRLRSFVADNRAAEQLQAKQAKQLKNEAQALSSKTRATRFGFIALLVFLAFVIIFVIWMCIVWISGA